MDYKYRNLKDDEQWYKVYEKHPNLLESFQKEFQRGILSAQNDEFLNHNETWVFKRGFEFAVIKLNNKEV